MGSITFRIADEIHDRLDLLAKEKSVTRTTLLRWILLYNLGYDAPMTSAEIREEATEVAMKHIFEEGVK